MARGAWTTTSPKSDPLRPSLVERAKKRQVQSGKSPDTWIVNGIKGLGDSYDDYLVREVDGVYNCDCHTHGHGEYRARKTCSHVTAVILYRQGKLGVKKEKVEEPTKVAEKKVDRSHSEWEIQWTKPVEPERESEPESPDLEPTLGSATNVATEDINNGFPLPSSISSPSEPPMPEKFRSFQHEQWPTIEKIVASFQEGFKVVFLDAPTGSGKTLIAEAIRRVLGHRGIYTCTTKTLQAQIMRDFGDYAKQIMGRNNYPTLNNPSVTAEDCTKRKRTLPACERCPGWTAERSWRTDKVEKKIKGQQSLEDLRDGGVVAYHCNNCHPYHQCPYETAKREAGMAKLAVLNTAYFLAENTFVATTPFRGWPLVILDEADRLEESLMGFVEVEIGPRMRKQLGIGLPAKKTDDEAWIEWLVVEVIPAIKKALYDAPNVAKDELDLIRKRRTLKRLADSVEWLVTAPARRDDEEPLDEPEKPVLQSGWVMTGYEKKSDDEATVTFKPVMVDQIAQTFLWRHAQRFLIMSASFVSPEQTASDLGLEDHEWTVVSMPSTFPPIRRPIFPVDVASVTNKTKVEAYPLIAKSIEKILDRHSEERILVHTVSYDLGKIMREHLNQTKHRSRISSYGAARFREGALKEYLNNPRGVLLAPSFDRGVDLAGEDCRVIIIPKVPFGNLGDKQISTRFWGTGRAGKTWYKVQAIRTLCQMTGRGMRSADDYCITYILDSEFGRLYSEARRLFPAWWSEAIVWDEYDPKWKELTVSVEGLT